MRSGPLGLLLLGISLIPAVRADWLVEVSGVVRPGIYTQRTNEANSQVIQRAGGVVRGQKPQVIRLSKSYAAEAQGVVSPASVVIPAAPGSEVGPGGIQGYQAIKGITRKLYVAPLQWEPQIVTRYMQAMDQALLYWSQTFANLGLGRPPFERVYTAEEAQVLVTFEELSSGVAGLAMPTVGLVQLDPSFSYFGNKQRISYNATFMYFTMIHELGHILGLDHTQEEGTLMYFRNDYESRPLGRSDIGPQSLQFRLGRESIAQLKRFYSP